MSFADSINQKAAAAGITASNSFYSGSETFIGATPVGVVVGSALVGAGLAGAQVGDLAD